MSIGEAAVEIVGDTSRFGESVRDGIQGNITSAAKIAAKAVAGIGLAAVGVASTISAIAIKGGISRALDTETARVQMQRMGLAVSDVDKLIGEVDRRFDGTIFTNPEGFKLTQQLVGAGAALDTIPDLITTIGDAAAHGNVPLQQMSGVFTDIIGQGRVTGEELRQLRNAGVPLTEIADSLGLTVPALRDITREGQFTSEMFLEAMASSEMLAGAAQAAGATTAGAWRTVNSQLARLGEIVVSPLFGEGGPMVQFFQALRQSLIDLRPFAEGFAAIVSERLVPALATVTTWLSSGGLASALDNIRDKIAPVTGFFTDLFAVIREEGLIAGLVSAFGELAGTIGGAISNVMPALIEGAQAAFDGLVDWLTSGGASMIVEGILEGRAKLLGAALELFPVILDGLIRFLPSLLTFITGTLLPQVVTLITTAVPQLTAAAVQLFTALVNGLQTILPPLLMALTGTVIPTLVNTITTMLPVILQAAVTLFQGLIDGLITILPILLNALANDVIPSILTLITESVPLILEAAVSLFTALIDGILEVLPVLVDTLLGTVLPDLVTAIVEMVPQILDAAVVAFTALIDALVDILPGLISTLLGTVLPDLLTTIVGMVPQILEAAVTAFTALATGLVEVLPEIIRVLLFDVLPALIATIVDMAPDLLAAMVEALGGLIAAIWDVLPTLLFELGKLGSDVVENVLGIGGRLLTAGREILGQLWEGMKQVWNDLAGWFEDRLDWLTGLWPFSPAKHGPLRQKDPYTAGANIVGQLAAGMRSAGPALTSAATSMMGAVASGISTDQVVKHGKELVSKLVDGMSDEARKSKDAVQVVKDSVMKSIDKLVKDEMDRLKEARRELQNLRRDFASMRDRVASSVMGELDLRGVARAEGQATFQDVAKTLTGLVTRAKTFAGLLKKLRVAGFPAGLIQEVAGLGTKDGIEIARALLSGTEAERAGLITDWGTLEKFSTNAGRQVAKATFDVAIAAQKGLVEGLAKETKELKAAAKLLAKNLAKWIKEELGIKSPSLVFREIGQDMAAGMAAGILSGVGAVRAAASELLDAATQPRSLAPMSPLTLAPSPMMAGGAAVAPAPVFRIDSVRVEIHGDVTREKAQEAGVTAAEAMLERLSTSRVVA